MGGVAADALREPIAHCYHSPHALTFLFVLLPQNATSATAATHASSAAKKATFPRKAAKSFAKGPPTPPTNPSPSNPYASTGAQPSDKKEKKEGVITIAIPPYFIVYKLVGRKQGSKSYLNPTFEVWTSNDFEMMQERKELHESMVGLCDALFYLHAPGLEGDVVMLNSKSKFEAIVGVYILAGDDENTKAFRARNGRKLAELLTKEQQLRDYLWPKSFEHKTDVCVSNACLLDLLCPFDITRVLLQTATLEGPDDLLEPCYEDLLKACFGKLSQKAAVVVVKQHWDAATFNDHE